MLQHFTILCIVMLLLFNSYINKIFTFGIKEDKAQGQPQICQEYTVKLLLQNMIYYSKWLRTVYQDPNANSLICCCNKIFSECW